MRKPTLDAVAELKKKIQEVQDMDPLVADAEEAIEGLSFPGHYENQSAVVRITVNSVGVHSLSGVLLFIDVKDTREVTPILRRLRTMGYKRVERSEYPEMKRITWKYRRPADKGPGQTLTVGAFLPYGEGARCDFVQVGTEEKPIYELRCRDDDKDNDDA